MIGSKNARTVPTRTLAARSAAVRSANRASSRSSVPSALTSRAASKLSWATSATSARSCWARVMAGDMYFWKTRLTSTAMGRTLRAATASHTSRLNSATAAMPIMTQTPRAKGSGLNTPVAASTSELAFDRSWPAGWARCQDMGRRRYWCVTAVRWRAWMFAYP